MIEILVECNLLIILIIVFRSLFHRFLSAKLMYRIWILVVLRMVPIGLFFGVGKQPIILNMISVVIRKLTNNNFAFLDFSVISIPWYLLTIWILGSLITFLWEYIVNFRFERNLFENRERLYGITNAYPVYQVSNLLSSCVFKVKGKYGIYIGRDVVDNSELLRVILTHEECHLKSRDLLWGKMRMIAVAIGWFCPLVWIAAIISKEDCEMSCDEKTIKSLNMDHITYGEMILDLVRGASTKSESFFCQAAMIAPTSHGLKIRIKKLVGKETKKCLQKCMGIVFLLICFSLCFFSTSFLNGMNGEELIRQYVYYSNHNYQSGMKELCLYEQWDYFFPHPQKIEGNIVSIKKKNKQSTVNQKKEEQEIYEVAISKSDNMKIENQIFVLVKETEDSEWKIDYRFS